MSAALSALALRHRSRRPSKPKCPGCGERDTEARVVVQVYEAVSGGRGKQIVSKTRTLCGECTAEVFDGIVSLLPEGQSHEGGRP